MYKQKRINYQRRRDNKLNNNINGGIKDSGF